MRLFFLSPWRRSESNLLWSCAKPFMRGLHGHKFGGRDRNARSEARNAYGAAARQLRQSVNGQEEWIDENENTLIAGVATSFIEALRADRFPLSNEQMGQL